MNDVILYLQVLEQEIGRILVVCHDSADFRSSHKDVFRFRFAKKQRDFFRIQQVQLMMSSANQVRISATLQFSPNGAAGQACVAGHINL